MRVYEAARTPQEMAQLASRGMADSLTIEYHAADDWKICIDGTPVEQAPSLIDAITIGRQFKEIGE